MIANTLTIAGTDPSGGAGIQADLKTFSALGTYGMSAITAVVAQNTCGVRGFVKLESAFIADQIDAVFEDVEVSAVKLGMMADAPIIAAVADCLKRHRPPHVVLDPVMVAKSGDHLLAPQAVDALRELLVPLASVITPNLPEAAVLLGRDDNWSEEEMHEQLSALLNLGSDWVLLKGGHLSGSSKSTDLLHGPSGTHTLEAPRIATSNDHGTGCTLSAAIAALLPHHSMVDAVARAKTYLHGALAASDTLNVGKGHGPLHHFHALWESG